jgi:RNA polymerase sigma-70 factor (ECF subfamily)
LVALTWDLTTETVPDWMADDDDAAWAMRARTDRAAFGVLYDRYVDRIYAYCRRRLQTQEAAEDATSQTFLKALGAIARYQPEAGTFRAWIFTIANRVVIDSYRREKSAASLDGIGDVRDLESGPEHVALDREASRELYALVDRLPEEQANLIQLRLAGLTDREIAGVLGRSYGAIRVAQHRAIKRLQELATNASATKRTRQ